MTLSDLGSIGEFVSSIAVVISLIYVAIQIRQNSRETRLASQQRALEASRDMITRMATKEATELFAKGSEEPDSLTGAEILQLRLLRTAQLRNIENAYLMHLAGVIDSNVFSVFPRQALNILKADPDILTRQSFTDEFSVWIREQANGNEWQAR